VAWELNELDELDGLNELDAGAKIKGTS